MASKKKNTVTCQVCCDTGYISYILQPADKPRHNVQVMERCMACKTPAKKPKKLIRSIKDFVIIFVLMTAFVWIAKEFREDNRQSIANEVLFTDEEIEQWEPFK